MGEVAAEGGAQAGEVAAKGAGVGGGGRAGVVEAGRGRWPRRTSSSSLLQWPPAREVAAEGGAQEGEVAAEGADAGGGHRRGAPRRRSGPRGEVARGRRLARGRRTGRRGGRRCVEAWAGG
ncbi:uncharacterized protein [Miscanthus floridulus]|uniref:uncharacterized protein n=1 Tax=Miscanthus floridulus TaxID=154761 RepID=UPI003459DC17